MATEKKTEVQEKPVITPELLAKELGLKDGKRVRAFLRQNFTRPDDQKNTSWVLTEKQAQAVRERFTPAEDEDADEES